MEVGKASFGNLFGYCSTVVVGFEANQAIAALGMLAVVVVASYFACLFAFYFIAKT